MGQGVKEGCESVLKMELVVLVVVVVLGSLASAQDNQTTLSGVFVPASNKQLHEFLSINELKPYPGAGNFSSWKPSTKLTLAMEIVNYTKTFVSAVASELSKDLRNVSVQSVYSEINSKCSTNIDDLRIKLKKRTCVEPLLRKLLASQMKHAIDSVLQNSSRGSDQTWPTLWSTGRRNCTTAYEARVSSLLSRRVENITDVPVNLTTPLDIITALVRKNAKLLNDIFFVNRLLFLLEETHKFSEGSMEPFVFENIINLWKNNIITGEIDDTYLVTYRVRSSVDELTWGVIRSNVGRVDRSCSSTSEENYLYIDGKEVCYITNTFRNHVALLSCAFNDSASRPLMWLPFPNIYFNSPCLCVAFNGKNCRVKPPTGVNVSSYCLSALLRDLQRRITYRPAVTYLDYSLHTRIPLCNFTNLLSLTLWSNCNMPLTFDVVHSVQCYFKDLVNKKLNCTETLPVTTFNDTVLCSLLYFVDIVPCDHEASKAFNLSYYGAGNSTLVKALTCIDVAARLFTFLSYLICPLLHNIPGKLMICYLLTSMVRLLVVHWRLDDLERAVRVDVTMDLASTFWLTAYLHFLTTSIKTLRLPDSLSPAEARQVLIRSALFGWVLPAALSASFFYMDEVVDSRVEIGQLLFLLCHYAALLANLYMFYYNCSFYYDVNSSINDLGLCANARNVFAGLFNFALKTSVLSGAGIIFRLALTQIHGLEHLLGYYHAVGTLHGFLLFVLYGCNLEARYFWLNVFRTIISRS